MKPHNPSPRGWQYWLRLVCFAGLALGLGLISLPAWYSVPFTLALLYAPCTDAGTRPVGSADAWEEVTLQARAGGSFRGYFMLGSPPKVQTEVSKPFVKCLFSHDNSRFFLL